MRAYLAIKYKGDRSNRRLIEKISAALAGLGIETRVIALEPEAETARSPQELMDHTFKTIDACDAVVVEFSEKGVGLGIEAGYARATRKPVVVVARSGSEISETLAGIAERIVFYDEPEELAGKLAFLAGTAAR